ncbi:cytochrome c oxidase subunit 5b [Kwoniella mangroviensis CBS 10435]|uniref:Cytochrome c oxidase subunit 4, mitochondrial n=1 Tax=Kwoniella mangroviensis CBS 10435 TaxID=1331196 RepID=A0A1B9IZR2_9TREE|nr:cytochrome c oxidase subunit 5b [Kwoniella mangroviensis CBS 8507]OCF61018.1 cytochrome c oxidase subunit 5b [Kwoniella mangroviensis CBS 10435]OCF66617.1 cytochrome c oxidase subunit 5b [Kwoniella mangroviensis CBS 8507]OCF74234.1 cytochrome c oxidase subunit 5b [Kwoniella mangroviensis CBS 8886]
MASVLRSFKAISPALRRPIVAQQPLRAFSVSVNRSAGHGPPQLLGPGAKAGEVPTDEAQSTGIERFELLGKLEGVDVFDMKPLEITRLGTIENPIPVYSLYPQRQVGCTGYPADSHDTIWLNLTTENKYARCPECGSVYTLNFQGDEALLDGGDDH